MRSSKVSLLMVNVHPRVLTLIVLYQLNNLFYTIERMAPKYANRRARRYRKHYKSKVPSNTTLAKKIKKIQYDQETKYHNENISTTADS